MLGSCLSRIKDIIREEKNEKKIEVANLIDHEAMEIAEGEEVVVFENLEEYIVSIYNDYIEILENDESTHSHCRQDFLDSLEQLKENADENKNEAEKTYFNFAKDIMKDDSENEPDTDEMREIKKAFVRILADSLTGNNDYDYFRKVKWLGKCNDSQWQIIGDVMGLENISKIFEKESVFNKEQEKNLP